MTLNMLNIFDAFVVLKESFKKLSCMSDELFIKWSIPFFNLKKLLIDCVKEIEVYESDCWKEIVPRTPLGAGYKDTAR